MPQITIPSANITFECDEHDTVLRAGLRAGLGMPYECNVGSCGNCRIEVLTGEVVHERENPPGWNERDKARNRYLGCQARPTGDCSIKVPMRAEYKSQFLPVRTTGKLVAIEDITHDIREFRVALTAPNGFLPGQYALLGVPGVQGGRAYSMANAGEPGQWDFQIRRVPGGEVTSVLFDKLQVGDEVGLDGPYGMAYFRDESPRDLLCMAGGSGLSPMISIARAFAASTLSPERKLHFIYGGRTPRDICGESILKTLPGFGTRVFYHCAISDTANPDSEGWTGRTGFVPDLAVQLFEGQIAEMEIYFAGPPPMADAIMKMAITHKAPAAQLHFDKFY